MPLAWIENESGELQVQGPCEFGSLLLSEVVRYTLDIVSLAGGARECERE